MKNIRDIYYEEELLRIVYDHSVECEITVETMRSSAVAVNLYYPDTVEEYLEYLKRVPQAIDIYIVSSDQAVINIVKNFAVKRANVTILKKENRGRDISAFLVALREQLMHYKYICFIHDKKFKYDYMREDVEFWIYNLWENTLGTENYIKNILGILEKNEIGMLVPPCPLGDHMDEWYVNAWYQNLENVKGLAEKMKLNADITYDKSPIALGTVFWANTKALKKILDISWDYGDFPDEPMPNDGTISHAIERILPYVVQDAGFDTGVIMTKGYAEKILLKMQKMMEESFRVLWDRFEIRNVYQLTHYAAQEKEVENIFSNCQNVYLYGAGYFGKQFLKMLKLWGYEPKGFVVSNGNRQNLSVKGYQVYELGEIRKRDNCGFIICTNYNLQGEIENSLIAEGFDQYIKIIPG